MCDGQLLAISQNTALFSLLGTTFGGDGRTTFGLPDLRGRAAIGQGTGPGLTPVQWGQRGGAEGIALVQSHLPSHNHTPVGQNKADQISPVGHYPGQLPYALTPANVTMNGASLDLTGGSQAHNNMRPFQVITFCIALTGIYPSRS